MSSEKIKHLEFIQNAFATSENSIGTFKYKVASIFTLSKKSTFNPNYVFLLSFNPNSGLNKRTLLITKS